MKAHAVLVFALLAVSALAQALPGKNESLSCIAVTEPLPCSNKKPQVKVDISKEGPGGHRGVVIQYDWPEQCYGRAFKGTLAGRVYLGKIGIGHVHLEPFSVEQFKKDNEDPIFPGSILWEASMMGGLNSQKILKITESGVSLPAYSGVGIDKDGNIVPALDPHASLDLQCTKSN